GVIGSLGIEIPGMADWSTELTTPEAPVIQFALRVMHQRDIRHAIMEVSSHSLLLQRVEGVQLALGIFLNLVPDEHLEFHPTPEHYLQTKLRFLELLRPDAPLVHNGDDPLTRDAMVRDAKRRPGADRIGISSHDSPDAAVWVKVEPHGVSGSRLLLQLRRELPRLDGGRVQAGTLELHFPRLGSQLAWNATIAATAALVVGASPDAIAEALPSLPPISRRMQVVHESGPLVVDDTAGNPRSIRAVLETVRSLDRRRAHIVYVVRGARGPAINRENGAAIADLATGLGAELMGSASEEQANLRNRVTAEERDAVLEALNAAGVTYRFEPRLDSAMDRTMADVARDDLVLLLGAQGMDAGADLARLALARNAGGSNSTAPASGQRAA